MAMTSPQSSGHPSTLIVMWSWAGHLVHIYNWLQHLTITWSPFATFPASIPKKSMGKVTSHCGKSLSSTHPPPAPCPQCYAGHLCTVPHLYPCVHSLTPPQASSWPLLHPCTLSLRTASLSDGNSRLYCCHKSRLPVLVKFRQAFLITCSLCIYIVCVNDCRVMKL